MFFNVKSSPLYKIIFPIYSEKKSEKEGSMVRKKLNVKEVIDGDTFIDSKGRKYRLENVDAPEKGKPG